MPHPCVSSLGAQRTSWWGRGPGAGRIERIGQDVAVRNGYRWTRLAVAVMAAAAVGTACGSTDSGAKATPPPQQAPAGGAGQTAGQNSAPSVNAATQRDQAWQAIDPCTLLQPGQLKPFLANTPVKPGRADADGKHTCAWGDGEFRSVRLSVWQPASAAELGNGAVRQVAVAGKQAHVVHDGDYTCEMQVGDERAAVDLQAVSMDKIKLCAETTTALTAVLTTLHW